MKNIALFIILNILLSCRVSKTIPYSVGDTKIYNNGVDKYIEAIQKKLEQKSLRFQHLVILYQPMLRENGNLRFRAVVYDTITKARYYLTKESGKAEIVFTSKTWRFVPMFYMLNYHLAGKIPFLKSLNQHGSESSQITNIYDINYITKHTQSYQLELVYFDDNGKPLTPVDYFLKNENKN